MPLCDLERLSVFVEQMKSTSSMLEKKRILLASECDSFVCRVLYYTYNPLIKFHITSKLCTKKHNISVTDERGEMDLFGLLDCLRTRTVTGNSAVRAVNSFIESHGHRALILSIIDKNLEIRMSTKSINSVFPGTVPSFEVSLAGNYSPKHCDPDTSEWYASRKMDGVRCIVRKEHGNVTSFSRRGIEFDTLGVLLKEIERIDGDFVLDGEVCLVSATGGEDFQGIMKEINRKSHTIKSPMYLVFDCLTIKEFDSHSGDVILSERWARPAMNRLAELEIHQTGVMVLPQVKLESNEHISALFRRGQEDGHEGIMIRKDVPYTAKRTNNLLKCKAFHDAEYVVTGIDSSTHRVIRDGKEVTEDMMSHAHIIHKKGVVYVGSGWTQQDRIRYHQHPDEIIGKVITVQYFEETTNQHGGKSLRFPTVKHVHENLQ